ncbi:unnamed protein product [Allacma fusca]|uniref:Uncharacterized protein n=1 Tax=Allacma fusca TaxID=39272 RepID=A0A8J2L723_9HEXA|nr:unnamed protein product [Allacma fusca]
MHNSACPYVSIGSERGGSLAAAHSSFKFFSHFQPWRALCIYVANIFWTVNGALCKQFLDVDSALTREPGKGQNI